VSINFSKIPQFHEILSAVLELLHANKRSENNLLKPVDACLWLLTERPPERDKKRENTRKRKRKN
jgi:hypothetical protein